MKKLLALCLIASMALASYAQNAGDKVDIMGRIGYCWKESESWSNENGVIIFNSVQWGGVAAWFDDEDWSGYSKVVYEFAEPTPLYTQIQLQRNNGEAYTQGAGTGSTSVEMSFEDKDVTSVKQIALQASGEATIVIKAIYLVVGDQGYADLITNGNCEGSETTNYTSKEYTSATSYWGPSRLVTDPTNASNKCIEVVSRDIPQGQTSIDDWDSQFFITVADKLRPGDEYVFSFKVRAEKAANSKTQAHNQPGQYNHWDMLGDIPFTTSWVNIKKTGTITEDQVYKAGDARDESNEMHTIAFNLAVLKEANKYYFDDIKFFVKKAPVARLIGDANGDGEVTITDVTTAVDYILSSSTGFIVFENADVNEDGEVNITDVTLIVDIILNQAEMITVTVDNTRYQKITGFGAAACDGAMCPLGTDTQPVKLLYGPESEIGLNIMRMEISPNFVGDVRVPEWGNWDTPYDWQGSVPSAQIVKQRGGIVFGTPWSPPGDYKTNGTAQGGNSDSQGNQRGQLREDCYDKFFPWLNTFLEYMKSKGVEMDAVSIQNEPDWWVDYSGCLYTPQQQLNLVKNYAHMLDRQTYGGVRLISAEPLGFDPSYSNMLLNDATARNQIDIIAGHLYGHPPLGNMKSAATLAARYGKEVWMTEHSVSDNIQGLPNWHEQLLFAEELNECMLSGCTAYIFWYMRAHWSFVGTGEGNYPGNTKNTLLPRAFVMSHFSKHVTGSTRLGTTASVNTGTNSAFETSAYIKGDSLIVMAIDTTKNATSLKLKLPVKVKSGVRLSSTSNESLCKETTISINKPTQELTVRLPERSLNTLIFIIDNTDGAAHLPQKGRSESEMTFAPLPLGKATFPIP